MSACTKKNVKEKKPVEVIVFEDPDKPRNKPKPSKDSLQANKNRSDMRIQPPVFDQRTAMYDIRKLAMTGMQEEDKEEAMVNYLVELGAKRPKGKPVPMKEYIEELKKRKLEGDTNREGGSGKKKQKRKKREKKDIFLDGQLGKWKKGVQFINPGKKFQKGT